MSFPTKLIIKYTSYGLYFYDCKAVYLITPLFLNIFMKWLLGKIKKQLNLPRVSIYENMNHTWISSIMSPVRIWKESGLYHYTFPWLKIWHFKDSLPTYLCAKCQENLGFSIHILGWEGGPVPPSGGICTWFREKLRMGGLLNICMGGGAQALIAPTPKKICVVIPPTLMRGSYFCENFLSGYT